MRFSLKIGDHLLVYDMLNRELVSEHLVVNVSPSASKKHHNIQLVPQIAFSPEEKNYWIYNLSNQCNGFVLKNNVILDHRRWGLLCSGAYVPILNNQFLRSQNAAIYLVNSDNYFCNVTSALPRNIVIANNRFVENWYGENMHPLGVIASRMNGHICVTRQNKNSEAWKGIKISKLLKTYLKNWKIITSIYSSNDSLNHAEFPIHALHLNDVSGLLLKGNQFHSNKTLSEGAFVIHLNNTEVERVSNNTSHGNLISPSHSAWINQ